jgi:hypothetical protein
MLEEDTTDERSWRNAGPDSEYLRSVLWLMLPAPAAVETALSVRCPHALRWEV